MVEYAQPDKMLYCNFQTTSDVGVYVCCKCDRRYRFANRVVKDIRCVAIRERRGKPVLAKGKRRT